MGASIRPLAEDLTCNSTSSPDIPFSTYSDLYYECHGRHQRLKIARNCSARVNNWGARRGRWAYSVEKYHWMLKITSKGALSDTFLFLSFPLLFLECSPSGCVKQALSLCSISKQSTGERLVSTFGFESCFSCSFILSLCMFPPPFFIYIPPNCFTLFDVK